LILEIQAEIARRNLEGLSPYLQNQTGSKRASRTKRKPR
jgi:hypothetical protein